MAWASVVHQPVADRNDHGDSLPADAAELNVDFFVSYTSADRPWAEWIAWELEHAGHSVIVQAWDMQPGSKFVLEMDDATQAAQRTIAVLSPAFLESRYARAEWAAAFAEDPTAAAKARACSRP